MKVTLQVNGRDKQVNTEQIAEKPAEGQWFKVNPLDIDQNLFKERREDSRQEATRKLILEAFAEMKKNPKYAKPFMTMMPEKTWESKNVGKLKKLASKMGDHNADWIEQALEWAQSIVNGETWKAICNEEDTANWYKLIAWDNIASRVVGSSGECNFYVPASHLSYNVRYDDDLIYNTVPLVVLYE